MAVFSFITAQPAKSRKPQSKRLEKGTFAWPKPGEGIGGKLPLRAEALSMLMDGVDLRGAKMRPWYERD
jgi:transposase